MKIQIFAAVLMMMLIASYAYAGGASCATATGLVPDGSVLGFDAIQPSSSNWYQFTAAAGRSYSVQVRDDVDPDNMDLTVTYYGPNSTCSSLQPSIPTSIASVTNTNATEPALPASASRSSIVTCATNHPAPCTGNGGGTYWIKVQNGSATASHYVNVTVSETTLYSAYWNTFSNFNTQWFLQNTTSQPINCLLSLSAGGVPYTSPLATIGAASWAGFSTAGTTFTPALPTGGTMGYTVITHNGPPGAVQAFADEYNFGSYATPVQFPISIGPMRSK
jgi:hypothetical protein